MGVGSDQIEGERGMTERSDLPFIGRWLLVRIDDETEDGGLVGLELDDCQARFKTWFDETIGVELGVVSFHLTGLQTSAVNGWWRNPK
jgi:hypothetical protein